MEYTEKELEQALIAIKSYCSAHDCDDCRYWGICEDGEEGCLVDPAGWQG